MDESNNVTSKSDTFYTRLIIVFIVALVLLFIGFIYYFFVYDNNDVSGRKTTYPLGSALTQYPGIGANTRLIENKLLVLPNTGRPQFVSIEEYDAYAEREDVEVVEIPQHTRLEYFVGYVQSWEDIPGSADKILILEGQDRDDRFSFRVSFEQNDVLFGDNPTAIHVENITVAPSSEQKIITLGKMVDFGYSKVFSIVKRGDVVVATPLRNLNQTNAFDERSIILASSILVRRSAEYIPNL